jgi:2-polyprenyl-3-methyl-5-hydroxy-6-metoxy-1,4-benzoquinol methylase
LERRDVNTSDTLQEDPDDVSAAVRAQYEEHPYPFWSALPPVEINDRDRDVLVAGCGSGLEILVEAKGSPRSRHLGIDLSQASLDFAARRAAEYDITNVRFIRKNILEVASLGETFDFIRSTGVLHHMENPLSGLLSLTSVLRPDGIIKFSVYSKLARRATLAAIALRKELNPPSTDEGIRGFRDLIRALPDNHPAKPVVNSPDFYSVAGTRDLLFHVQEHNFTIPELAEMVSTAGLRIVSWGPSAAVLKLKSMGYEETLDWRVWHEAELKRPGLFASGMYTLTVAKA